MTKSSLKQTHLQIVNEVQRLLGVNVTSSLDTNAQSLVLMRFLNEVLSECADYGDFQEMYAETTVLASSSVEEYTIDPGEPVHHIHEIRFDTDVAPLQVRSIQDIRRLQQTRSFGRPRQFAVVGVDASSGNPNFRPYQIPGSNEDGSPFKIAYYTQPALVTAAATASTPAFPANLIIKGVYAAALLEENGGEPTAEYQLAFQKYTHARNEALARFNADTGALEVYFQPGGHRRR
ncbi:MAG: hypothetical protein J3T61_00180 [Candidatus Brocadiales bacterium]|nr:hypothetical protein [Candidatus Bathyanammoxibius sp.]